MFNTKNILHFLFAGFLFLTYSYSQKQPSSPFDRIKNEAYGQMKFGRYGEAIDLWNKFITTFPQNPEGYNQRGLCYEKRQQYESAVYDFRAARKLAPQDKEINANLARATRIWYDSLDLKIAGHKREIAIDSHKPINYLEIGKCHKHKGEWLIAEEWYDEYLKRDKEPGPNGDLRASPDEIIRYTEILARNNHIQKGEPILKRYTERYPNDHRIWSRYGYFTLWLGKIKIAIDAFEEALKLRPYFKEAQDGLDIAKGKPYNWTIFDTTYKYQKQQKPVEYAIDKYYRMLRKQPEDFITRYLLIDELIKVDRLEEAYQQLKILEPEHAENDSFKVRSDTVSSRRTEFFKRKIEEYQLRLTKNPNDKEAVLKISDYYANLFDYDNAILILEKYIQNSKEGSDLDVRFKHAQFTAWNREFDKSIQQVDYLVTKDPTNIDYQLLHGQVSVWTGQQLDQASNYFNNVLNKQPKNIYAILGLASIYIKNRDFPKANEYLTNAKTISPDNKDVEAIQSNYDIALSKEEEIKLYSIINEGRNLWINGNISDAVIKYDEYFSKNTAPSDVERMEYASLLYQTNNFSSAIDQYNQILAKGYNFDVALGRAKLYLWTGDSAVALTEFQRLTQEDSSSFEAKLFLGDAFQRNRQYSNAAEVYEKLLENNSDTAQIAAIKLRQSWMPVSGLSGFLSTFPSYRGLAPIFQFYSDNYDFKYYNAGASLELGVLDYMSLSITFNRGNFSNPTANRFFSIFKGGLVFRFKNYYSISGNYGNLTYSGAVNRKIFDIGFRFDNTKNVERKKNLFTFSATFENSDAGLIFYSDRLINYRIGANFYTLNAEYLPNLKLKFIGYYRYIKIEDGNLGNDLQLRVGREFDLNLWFGYEYLYSRYARSSNYYYAPTPAFESHSIWGEWTFLEEFDYKFQLVGKIGYIPALDFFIREIGVGVTYKPLPNLFIAGRITISETFRFDTSYRYFNSFISAYWSF